eukprot:GABV01000186.1.p1 GENE.GABV01000186.1~~GABV01000186.1.p1  ORF type:complete len:407 (-),score=111.89 GABV01000186.1:248-1468(-)
MSGHKVAGAVAGERKDWGVFSEDFGSDHRFMFLDLTPVPGLNTILNINGLISDDQLDRIELELNDWKSQRDANGTGLLFVSSHYCWSSISSTNFNRFWKVMSDAGVTAFFCGHSHRRQMWKIQKSILMLEVGSLWDNQQWRIAAADHDMFTFRDFPLQQDKAPVVGLLTNPPDARSLTDRHAVFLAQQSTHIRALLFSVSESPITRAWVKISPHGHAKRDSFKFVSQDELDVDDDEFLCELTTPDGSQPHFWTCPWPVDVAEFHGVHQAHILIQLDSEYELFRIVQPISVDGEHQNMGTSSAQIFGTQTQQFVWFLTILLLFLIIFYGFFLLYGTYRHAPLTRISAKVLADKDGYTKARMERVPGWHGGSNCDKCKILFCWQFDVHLWKWGARPKKMLLGWWHFCL